MNRRTFDRHLGFDLLFNAERELIGHIALGFYLAALRHAVQVPLD